MKKHIFGRQFKRDTNERKALFKGLMTELILHEKIETTEEKAKAIRSQVEKLVTKAKRRGQESRQFLQPYISSSAVEKIIVDLAPRFADRPGGYVRIIKLGSRFSDNADMAVIEWTEKSNVDTLKPVSGKHVEEGEEVIEVISPRKTDTSDIQDAEIVLKTKKDMKVKEKKEAKKDTEDKKVKKDTKKEMKKEPKKK